MTDRTHTEPAYHFLLLTETQDEAGAIRSMLDGAPFAYDIREVATEEEAFSEARIHPPSAVVVVAPAADELVTRRLRRLQTHISPSPLVLLVASGSGAALPAGVVLLPRKALGPDVLQGLVQGLARTQRLTETVARLEADRQRVEGQLREWEASRGQAEAARAEAVADIGHALRSPLNALIGYAELLVEELEQRGDDEVLTEVQRLLHLGRRIGEAVGGLTVEPAPRAVGPRPSGETPSDATSPGAVAVRQPEAGDLLLLIDDDDDLRGLLARYLQHEGFQVKTASDGQEGLRMARILGPAAITLDVEMPGLDGWEVLEQLRADARLAQTPVIMLTGRGNEHVAAQALRHGVDDYLMKGALTGPTLCQAINGALNRARARQDGGRS